MERSAVSPGRAMFATSLRRSQSWTELSTTDYVLERIDEEEHDLNWKVFLEVYLEDYHIGVVHPGFRAMVDPTDLRAALQRGRRRSVLLRAGECPLAAAAGGDAEVCTSITRC